MDKSAIKFEVLREANRVLGFRLIGVGQTEAESFCYSFPTAVEKKNAEVIVEGNRITFKHSGNKPAGFGNIMLYSEGGEYSAELEEADADALQELLKLKGFYSGRQLRCTYVNAWGRGFELRALSA